jgi:hypothetical protein
VTIFWFCIYQTLAIACYGALNDRTIKLIFLDVSAGSVVVI